MTAVNSNQKRKCAFSSDVVNTKIIRTSALNPRPRVVDLKKCHIIFQDLWDELEEDLAAAIRTSLRKRGADGIALKVDRAQALVQNRILGSQQSKLPGLKMFATADGSMWLDHFYDEIAANVLEDKTVRKAIDASLSESAKPREKSGERGAGPHIALPLIAGVDLISNADQTVSTADARLLALLPNGMRMEFAYATIILPSGVAKMDTTDFSVLPEMTQEDIVHVPLLILQQALMGQMPATVNSSNVDDQLEVDTDLSQIAAVKHRLAERRVETTGPRPQCLKPSKGSKDDDDFSALLAHAVLVDQSHNNTGDGGGCFLYAGREVAEDTWSDIFRSLD